MVLAARGKDQSHSISETALERTGSNLGFRNGVREGLDGVTGEKNRRSSGARLLLAKTGNQLAPSRKSEGRVQKRARAFAAEKSKGATQRAKHAPRKLFPPWEPQQTKLIEMSFNDIL